MSYKYYQQNRKDLKDDYGDCAIRCYCKAENLEWLEAYDKMWKISREIQCPMNCKHGFEEIARQSGYAYHGISNKRGSKRPTVKKFANEHKSGTYMLVVANHYVCSSNGDYYDTWDSGDKSLYGYWKKVEKGDIVNHNNFECRVLDVFKDEDDGKQYASIEPTGHFGFPVEVEVSKL